MSKTDARRLRIRPFGCSTRPDLDQRRIAGSAGSIYKAADRDHSMIRRGAQLVVEVDIWNFAEEFVLATELPPPLAEI